MRLAFCDGLGGGVVGAAGEDGSAAGGDFDGDLDDAMSLGFGEGRGFAGGAAGDEERDALGELRFDEGTERQPRRVNHRGGTE